MPETNVLILPSPQDTGVLYYRNLAMVAFDDTVSGTAIRAFFERYRAVVIGGADYVGLCGGYILQIPDPGSTWAALDRVLTKMEHEPGVAEVMDLTYRDRGPELRGTGPLGTRR